MINWASMFGGVIRLLFFLGPNLWKKSSLLYHKSNDISYPKFWSAFVLFIYCKILLLLIYP